MPLAVCATPIGNLDDVTLRVLDELRAADVVLAEDTRRTRALLQRHGIAAHLVSYHEHNEARRVEELLPRLAAGERIALVTDAGMPLVSDPGARLVAAALDARLPVTVLPGPSAVETALVASGLAGPRFVFVGFLPRRAGERTALWREVLGWDATIVAFESPRRLGASLHSLAAVAPARRVAVCRELTKVFEEVARGTAAELAEPLRRAAERRDHPRGRGGAGRARPERGALGGRRARRRRNAPPARRRRRRPPDGHVPERPLPRDSVTSL